MAAMTLGIGPHSSLKSISSF